MFQSNVPTCIVMCEDSSKKEEYEE